MTSACAGSVRWYDDGSSLGRACGEEGTSPVVGGSARPVLQQQHGWFRLWWTRGVGELAFPALSGNPSKDCASSVSAGMPCFHFAATVNAAPAPVSDPPLARRIAKGASSQHTSPLLPRLGVGWGMHFVYVPHLLYIVIDFVLCFVCVGCVPCDFRAGTVGQRLRRGLMLCVLPSARLWLCLPARVVLWRGV